MEKEKRTTNSDRLPPHAVEAEMGVLACVFMDPGECLGDAREALPDDNAFYDLRNRAVWDVLGELDGERAPVDLLTVRQRLKDRNLLEQVGGDAYLAQVQDAAPSTANLTYYLGIVREKHLLRRWIALCVEIVERIHGCERNVEGLVADISTQLFKLCEGDLKLTEKHMREVMADVQELYLDKFRRGVKHKIGPQTGFNYLDNILPGLGPGQLIVLAARPRTGKSAMVMQMAENIAAQGVPAGVVSLEMSASSLGARAVFQRAGADLTKFLNGFMSDSDVQKLVGAAGQLCGLPIHIDESARLSIEDLEIRARRMTRRHGLGVLIVDYFQLLYVRNRHKQWSKSDELAECSMRLKALAKELKIPIVLCAQMNREIEKETHRRPRLSDLRDTGQLEQDADVIMFLWKPDLSSQSWKDRVLEVLPRVPVQMDWKLERTWKKNLALVICTVEKQREGRSGEDSLLVFIKPWTRFVDAYTPEKLAQQPVLEPEPALAPEPEEGAD